MKRKRLLACVLSVMAVISFHENAFAATSVQKQFEKDMEEIENSVIGAIPSNEYSVLSEILSRTDDTLLEDEENSSNNVWWDSDNREGAGLTYIMTDWTYFEGLRTTIQITPGCKAILSDDMEQYVEDLENAAVKYGFASYKELFKALAQARHTTGDQDIFAIGDTGLNPNPGKEVKLSKSIEIAAKLFASCIQEAGYPDPSNKELLKALLQAFEFEGEGFITYCNNTYTVEWAEAYARELVNGVERTDAAEIEDYGRYILYDQKFPNKVLQFYSIISVNMASIPADEMQLLNEAIASWPSDLSTGRVKVIETGLSLYGKITYSMDLRLQPSESNPQYLDCSSFVGWSFNHAGFTDVSSWWCTGDFWNSGKFRRIGSSELRPGDVGQKNTNASGADAHIGIYIGKSASGQNVWLHCTGGSLRRIVVNTYSGFAYSQRYNGFTD